LLRDSQRALDLGPGIAAVITFGSLGSPGIEGEGTTGMAVEVNVRAIFGIKINKSSKIKGKILFGGEVG
jgi:hypothetical protein